MPTCQQQAVAGCILPLLNHRSVIGPLLGLGLCNPGKIKFKMFPFKSQNESQCSIHKSEIVYLPRSHCSAAFLSCTVLIYIGEENIVYFDAVIILSGCRVANVDIYISSPEIPR